MAASSHLSNQKSEIRNHKLFTISTPTAIVNDLGTEFGVEVGPKSGTQVCVMQGRVVLQPSAAGATESVLLERGQFSRVNAGGMLVKRSETEKNQFAVLSSRFVRHLPQKTLSAFVSLTDLVAGGDGFGDRSFWGIDPRDASVVQELPSDVVTIYSSKRYERYSGLPQIDGVFIPDGGNGSVQLDSAGHTFALPKTSGRTCDTAIWAYKGRPWEGLSRTKPIGGQDSKLSSMLLLHANAGITFDLAAIRVSARGCRATRFQSTVHNCQWGLNGLTVLTADVWVFIDGQLRFSRTKIRRQNGPVEVDIPLGPNDRFLTLVSTDGGDDINYDSVCFLSPRVCLDAVP